MHRAKGNGLSLDSFFRIDMLVFVCVDLRWLSGLATLYCSFYYTEYLRCWKTLRYRFSLPQRSKHMHCLIVVCTWQTVGGLVCAHEDIDTRVLCVWWTLEDRVSVQTICSTYVVYKCT